MLVRKVSKVGLSVFLAGLSAGSRGGLRWGEVPAVRDLFVGCGREGDFALTTRAFPHLERVANSQ